jgi:ankyrin repeat protein
MLEIFMAIVPESELFVTTSGPECNSLLHLAVQSQNLDAVFFLLRRPVNRRSKNLNGQTAAHIASQLGNTRVLRQLLESDKWLLDETTPDGFTPLHEAARYNNVEALRFLLFEGANPEAKTLTGFTPLLIGTSFGASSAVQELLIQGVDFMTVDDDKVNVLQHAVGHSKTLNILLKCIKNIGDLRALISSVDKRKATALHYAAQFGNKSDVFLLTEKGANQAAGDENGATPLHLASGRGNLPIVEQLCSTAPRTIHAVDLCGRTPLHIACLYGKTKVAGYLTENGATLVQDRDGRTAFHCAAWHGSIDCLKVLLASFPSDLNIVDVEKATALHLAVAADHPDVTEFLLDNSASVTNNDIGQNCLDVAINKCLESCAYTIVNHERYIH